MPKQLTQSYVSSLKANPDNPIWITDAEVKNLKLYIGISGAKVWYFYYLDKDGRKASKKLGSFDALTVAQARDMAKDVAGRVVRGENLKKEKPKQELSLGDFINNTYAQWRLSTHKAAQSTLNMMKSQFGSAFYSRPIKELKVSDFYAWRNSRLEQGKKATTVNKNIVALKAALNWAVKHGYIESNPLEKLELLKEYDSEIKVRYLTDDERERLYAALDARETRIKAGRDSHNEWLADRDKTLRPDLNELEFADHLKPMIIISLNTGIRRGSLFQLRWSDINFQEGFLSVLPFAEKTGKLVHIPMNIEVKETLEAWQKQTRGKNSELVFPSPRGGNRFDNCKKAWAGLMKDAQIEKFRWHDMRHDFASQLVMRGVDLNTARELMGHSDMTMTLRYAHLAPAIKQAAVNLLSRKEYLESNPRNNLAISTI